MTGIEWSNAFKKIEGREPSPQEFMEAKKAGFPELVVEKSGGLTAAQWTELFKEVNKRTPSPQEFLAAKAQGFPAIDSPEVDENLVTEHQEEPKMPENNEIVDPVQEASGTQPSLGLESIEEVQSAQVEAMPEEPVAEPAQPNTVQEGPVVQAGPEIEVTEEEQPAQAVATPEEATVTMETSQTSQEPQPAVSQPVESVQPAANGVPPVDPVPSTATYVSQPAANQNPQQISTGLRILRVLAMIAIVLLTIALAVILGYFALGPLLEMLG